MEDISDTIIDNPVDALSFSYDQILDFLQNIKNLLTKSNEFPLIKLSIDQYKNAVVYFAGDTHGDYLSTFEVGKYFSTTSQQNADELSILVFLGDYVDRAPEELKFGSIIDEHFEDFISCIRTRKKPKADIEEAHLSMLLCHLANISYRVGNRKLKFNGAAEKFVNDTEADKYLKANYRKAWVIPEEV